MNAMWTVPVAQQVKERGVRVSWKGMHPYAWMACAEPWKGTTLMEIHDQRMQLEHMQVEVGNALQGGDHVKTAVGLVHTAMQM